MTEHSGQKLGIDWLKTFAGALAAVSAALLLSTVGAAGTIIGAAVGSVVATVGGALYSQGLALTHNHLSLASRAARRKVGVPQAEIRRANRQPAADQVVDAQLTRAEERLMGEAKGGLVAAADEPVAISWRERLVTLPWKRISLAAAGLFAVTILAITVFELVAGQTLSSITGGTDGGGGTSITRIGGGDEPSTGPSPTQPTSQTSPTGEGTVGPLQQPSGSTTAVPSPTTPTSTTSPTSPATTASSTPPAPTASPTSPATTASSTPPAPTATATTTP